MTSFRTSLIAFALLTAPAMLPAEDGHGALPPSVERFHDILSKDWHAPEGPDKLRNACAHTGAYVIASQEVVSAKTPDTVDAQKWSKAAGKLSAASTDFATVCGSSDNGKIAKGLSALHDRFHDLVKLLRP